MELYTLENEFLRAKIADYGARLVSLEYKGVDVVCGPEAEDLILDTAANFGACVGRYANRIAKACFTLDGVEYRLPANDGENCLHGGHGYANRYYKCEYGQNGLICSYLSPDLEDGFPGELKVEITYSLSGAALRIEYRALCDKKTVCNLTNHTYFNLNGGGSVLDHTLCISADLFTPTDGASIPLAENRSVEGTPFDFREPRKIGERIGEAYDQLTLAHGYDHNYVLPGNGFRKCASLVGDKSGIKMDVYTDMPGIQLYTANYMNNESPCLKGGVSQTLRGAVCLETQYYPDTPNRPDFPSCVLLPGDEYYSVTEYAFS